MLTPTCRCGLCLRKADHRLRRLLHKKSPETTKSQSLPFNNMAATSQEAFRGPPNTSLSSQPKSGKRLRGWPKKRSKANPHQNLIVQPVLLETGEKNVIIEIQALELERNDRGSGEFRWAAIWLRRLQQRKKQRKSDLKSPPKILTLAEQLQEAQQTPLDAPDSRVYHILL